MGGLAYLRSLVSATEINVGGMKNMLMAAGEKKILLLNFPNNPTGYTATVTEDEAITRAILQAAMSPASLPLDVVIWQWVACPV